MVKSIWHGILNGSFLGLYQDTNTVFRTVCSLELSIYQCLCIMWKLLIPCWDSIVNDTIWKNCMVTIWQNVSPSSKKYFSCNIINGTHIPVSFILDSCKLLFLVVFCRVKGLLFCCLVSFDLDFLVLPFSKHSFVPKF